jgi:NAD(P)-dependent dehydrogenase (short-subunit alcohol dehydrogenase family)
MKLLANKWALVTGSSRGIGQRIAIGLAERKCNVIVHGRQLDNTDETMHKLCTLDVDCFAIAGDLDAKSGIESIVGHVKDKIGYVDILYNNAAIMNDWKELHDITLEEWQQSFFVNFFAMVELCNAFVPTMVERKFGRVINVTSGIKDVPQLAPYSTSKAAVDKYTADLAAQLAGTNVLANCLDPGWVKTDLGGENADYEVETVLPGALVPALLEDNGQSGQIYRAQDYKHLG